MNKGSYGGAQGRAGGVGAVKHGFPRVPHDVTEPKQLRRYLQSQRDGLNEWRWLFDGLSELTSAQRARLVQLLVQLAQQNTQIQNQQALIVQLQAHYTTLLASHTALQGQFTALQMQYAADQIANAADHVQFTNDITQLQNDYATLLSRVNCLDANAGNPCP